MRFLLVLTKFTYHTVLQQITIIFSFRNFTAIVKEIIKNGGIDASPTKDLISQFIDEEKVRNSDIKFGMVTFHMSELTPLEIFIDKIPEGKLIDYLLASSKVPGVSNIGPEGEWFLDGGVYFRYNKEERE